MSKAIRIEKNGGPEVLQMVDVQVGNPGPGEIRIRHKAVGLNFIDIYQRDGTCSTSSSAERCRSGSTNVIRLRKCSRRTGIWKPARPPAAPS